MEFEWDAAKSNRNLSERGFGFDLAAAIFEGIVIEYQDARLTMERIGSWRSAKRTESFSLSSIRIAMMCAGSSPHVSPTKRAERMAVIRKSLNAIKASKPKINRNKILATTEADIRQAMREDDEDPNASSVSFELLPKTLRLKHGMTQEQFADALRIPVATLRNWEQGRVEPDPAAKSLMRVFAKNPKAVLRALA